MPTPKPSYPAAFRQQMVELVRAGRGIREALINAPVGGRTCDDGL
jgi:hypothetical protein